MNRFVYVLLLVVLFAAEVFAQGSEDSSMQEDTSVADLLSLVASDHGVKIYYQRQWVDTLAFKGDLEALSLREALDLLLKGTNIKSYFFDNGDVLLTRVFTLYPDLSDSFFESDDNTGGGIDVVAIEVEKNLILGDSDDNAPKVIEVGKANGRYLRENVKVSGIVSNQETLEPVIGAYVYLESPAISTITDADGRFELLLPVGNQEVFLKSFGMQSTSRKVVIYGPGTLDLSLKEHVTALNEIVIEADRDQNIRGVQTGTATLDIQTIKNLPAVFGEVDVVKSILTLPGVETVGEAATGFNVRGGTVGQNLVLLNGGTVYNPSHLFGFFSAFNGDLVQDVELMKSGIPAKYGGRISSVLEVQTEEGDMSEGSVEGAIGPLTGKILYQGPIVKEKLSILAGVRSSYSNWLLRQVPNASYQNSSADFGDANLVLKYQVDAKNSLTLSGYLSRDKFDLATDTVYTYHNQVLGLSWKHAKSDRLNFDVAYHYSGYGFGLDYDEVPENAFTLQSRINHHELNLRGTFFSQSEHSFEFGVNNIFYRLRPGDVSPGSGGSFVETKKIAAENGLETSIFISDQF
ncbi:MAG: TonB-dependent receptor, partial [Cyclobacteriaceae bacterium]|nr:TonB-dependent receptor [Cyclobacteriaceae bacterium HetDA_MAG_MS6]